jgi:hypothetical protein
METTGSSEILVSIHKITGRRILNNIEHQSPLAILTQIYFVLKLVMQLYARFKSNPGSFLEQSIVPELDTTLVLI